MIEKKPTLTNTPQKKTSYLQWPLLAPPCNVVVTFSSRSPLILTNFNTHVKTCPPYSHGENRY